MKQKGDHLANDDSENKLILGRKWQEAAGRDYRYMMVFEKKEFQHDGAYTLDEFAEVIKSCSSLQPERSKRKRAALFAVGRRWSSVQN